MSAAWWLHPGIHETPRMRYKPPWVRMVDDLIRRLLAGDLKL